MPSTDRSPFTTNDIITDIWTLLNLPEEILLSAKYQLPSSNSGSSLLPSSFKLAPFAQATIALAALSASLVRLARNGDNVLMNVTVPLRHACVEFQSERYLAINGERHDFAGTKIGGLKKVGDGMVRVHDGFGRHRSAALDVLGCGEDEMENVLRTMQKEDVERRGMEGGAVIGAMRSFEEWNSGEQARAMDDCVIKLRKVFNATRWWTSRNRQQEEKKLGKVHSMQKNLQGVKVLDLSRVLAAPIAARTLAAHGADVLWVTSPHLEDLPECDRDTARGKRTIQLDLRKETDITVLKELIKEADVFLQGYRPEALARMGLRVDELVKMNGNLVVANLSAWGVNGPWKGRRGFDSIVQTVMGFNVAEAEAFGGTETARIFPCQALDHGSGYLLATGICAALYKREMEGGAWVVDVSLAGTGKYLRSLGQYEGRSGFQSEHQIGDEELAGYQETRMSGFGMMTGIKHSASIEGDLVGWNFMPEELGSDEPRWLKVSGCDV